jgi:hypothetical protein
LDHATALQRFRAGLFFRPMPDAAPLQGDFHLRIIPVIAIAGVRREVKRLREV